MSDVRLIDANVLLEKLGERYLATDPSDPEQLGYLNARIIVRNQPTSDAVPVVRCKECWKRGNERECPMCHEEFDGCDYCTIDYTSDDGFCHMGEKMDGGATDGSDA